ncbi:MAG: DNA primase [Acholeplasmatales bacterium]|nr:DNA primase [Acholeplasmatales bacterium]
MTDEELNNLIGQTDLVSLVSKYVTLEKKGKNYMGCCPFHNEKTPSFVVSPEKGIFNCFGCHKGGNALTFIKEIENIDTKSAIKELCEFNGVEYKDSAPKKENPNSKYYKLMNTAKDFYKLYLNQDKAGVEALKYLESRGLTKDIIEQFEIGLAPSNGDTIHQVLLKQGFLELDMADMSLIEMNNRGFYDIFTNRIMFPIKNEKGDTIAFSARIFNNPDKSQPKYINSRETKIFVKGETLFNLNLARPYINKMHRVILHEGQMDVIASYKAGLGEAVCSLGTAFSINQANKLRTYTDNVIICYDGDQAGINASLKAIKIFKNAGFKVHLVLLPAKMDPDEYVLKYGKDEYVKYFESHIIDDVEYQYKVLFINKNLSDKDVLENIRKEAFKLIFELDSSILEDKYLNRLSTDLTVSIDAVKKDFDKYVSTHARNIYHDPYEYPVDIAPVKKPIKKNEKKYGNLAEIKIFLYAIQNKYFATTIDKKISDSLQVLSEDYFNIWDTLIHDYYLNYDEFNEGKFIRLLNENLINQFLNLMDELKKYSVDCSQEDLNDCIEKINDLAIEKEYELLDKQFENSSSEEEKMQILLKKMSLKGKQDKKKHNDARRKN